MTDNTSGDAKDIPGGGSGGENNVVVPKRNFKVSKVMLWPSRKINLGNFATAELNAGLELVFDEPVDIYSEDFKQALNEGRKAIREEMAKQFEPYKKLLENK